MRLLIILVTMVNVSFSFVPAPSLMVDQIFCASGWLFFGLMLLIHTPKK